MTTQIGPDGKRHEIEDLPNITEPDPNAGDTGWQVTLLGSASRNADGETDPLKVGDRTDARLELDVTALTGTNEVQTVTINDATGGTFTLTYSGQTTAAIAWNAAASAVQSALVALSNIGTGDVAVTGNAGGPYTVTFQGALGSTNVAQLTSDAGSLTSGTTATISHATTTAGVTPLLDVGIETGETADGTFAEVEWFSQVSSVGNTRQLFTPLDEYIKVVYTIVGGSLTFSVKGEIVG